MPAAQTDRRFRKLTPEKFLRGDPKNLKATLGQLVEQFGDAFLIKTPDLIDFYEQRNLLAHGFYRAFHLNIRGAPVRKAPKDFLRAFISDAVRWTSVLRGLLAELKIAAAIKEGRESEVVTTDTELECIKMYREHAQRHLTGRPR